MLSQIKLIELHLKQKHVAIVTNTTVAPLYLDPLLTLLKQHGIKAFPIILPDGESYKNQETLNLNYDALLKEKCERTTSKAFVIKTQACCAQEARKISRQKIEQDFKN